LFPATSFIWCSRNLSNSRRRCSCFLCSRGFAVWPGAGSNHKCQWTLRKLGSSPSSSSSSSPHKASR
jgi:hypothetical protein